MTSPPPAFACVLFAICPLQLRYATEGRPYELALLFSILGSLFALRLNRAPSLKNTAIYTAILTTGVYFQPLVAFVAMGNAMWAGLEGIRTKRLRPLGRFALASAVAAAGFVVWYRFASPAWHYQRVAASPKLPLFLVREIAGDGYLCSIPLIAATLAGFRQAPPLVAITTLAALLGPLAADAGFGYFFAIRQFLFALPGLAVTASIGFVEIRKYSKLAAVALMLTFVAGAMVKTASYFSDRREDWGAAATYLDARSGGGDCVSFLAPDSVVLYALFAPRLEDRVCSADDNTGRRVIALAPEMPDRIRQEFQRESAGLRVVSIGGTLIATRE